MTNFQEYKCPPPPNAINNCGYNRSNLANKPMLVRRPAPPLPNNRRVRNQISPPPPLANKNFRQKMPPPPLQHENVKKQIAPPPPHRVQVNNSINQFQNNQYINPKLYPQNTARYPGIYSGNSRKGNSIEQIKKQIENKDKVAKKLKARKKKKFRNAVFFALAIIIIIMAFNIIAHSLVFVANFYKIDGLKVFTAERVLEIANLKNNQSLSTIDPVKVKANIENTGLLVLEDFKYVYPNSVYMKIHERVPIASISSNGQIYLLDSDGIVLETVETSSADQSLENYIQVRSMAMHATNNGQQAKLRFSWQKQAFKTIMSELERWSFATNVESISLSEQNNIYLTLRSGIIVRFGDISKIEEKIKAAITINQYVLQNGITKGSIDVNNPINATFADETPNVEEEIISDLIQL